MALQQDCVFFASLCFGERIESYFGREVDSGGSIQQVD